MATAIAAVGAGSQAASAGSGLIGTIGDLVYRGQELALSREALKQQVEFNNKSLALAAASPFLNAAASGAATKYVTAAKIEVLRGLGASNSTVAALAAGQDGVYVNGNIQPIHYDNSMFNAVQASHVRPTTYTGVNSISMPATTINKTVNNNVTRNYEAGYRQARNAPSRNGIPTQWRPTSTGTQSTAFPVGTYNSAASGRFGSYDVNATVSTRPATTNTARTNGLDFTVRKGEANALVNNWYQFGFLAPGGTRL
ncbi:VP2 [Duck calicivirus 2]|nr:VP2 [Duck calicivirus 2]